MIAELIVILIGFGLLFYFKHKVDQKLELMNEYRLKLYEDKYHSLLKKDREYFMDIKELARHLTRIEKELVKLTKNKEDMKNVFSLNKKK